MPNLADTLAKLKSTIVQTSTQRIDAKLDQAVKDIVKYKSHTGRNGYIELVKDLISKTADVKLSGTGGGLFQQQGVGAAAFGQGGRIMRYKIYQSIISHIPYCHRALTVLVDNILSPDDITKESLDVKPKKHIEDEVPTASRVRYMKEVIEVLDLERYLSQIVRSTLLFGDFFCEVGDPKTALTSRSILSESEYQTITEHIYSQGIKDRFNVTLESQDSKEHINFQINIDWSAFSSGERMRETEEIKQDARKKEEYEGSFLDSEKNRKEDEKEDEFEGDRENKEKKDTKRKEFRTLKDLKLIFHDPKNVLKLQSSLFPICFGYLVFPPANLISGQMLADTAINGICMAVLKNLEKKIPNMKEFKNDSDLKDILKGMVSQADLTKALEIRYVPASKMTHFMVPTTKYFPYGESVFDPSQFTAKVLIAMETALTIGRLARSTEKRKIAVEIGLPRDAKVAIEAMKEEFRKRKISLDSFGTIDTIPSMITTFEDIYIPQRDGKPFVDVSTFTEGHMETRNKVDELKLLRDQVVAGLSVPPAFIGIEENLSNKCLDLLTKIPLLSGKSVMLQDLINEFNLNGEIKDKYAYSYNRETGRIAAGKIIWAGITRKAAKVVKITLDNGEYEIVTPDHHYMLRDGEYIEAQNLKPGDSLMPLYTKLTHYKTTLKNIPYEMVYHPGLDEWQATHRMVAVQEGIVTEGDKLNVHHVDFNPLNNDPSNLEGLNHKNHLNIHIEHKQFVTTGRGNVKIENYVEEKCTVCNENYTRHIQNNQITCLKAECIKEIRRVNGIKSFKKREHLCALKIKLLCPFCQKEFYRSQRYIDDIKSGIITCGSIDCYRKSFITYGNTEERKIVASDAGKKGGNKSKEKLVAYNKLHGAPTKGMTKETHPEYFERRTATFRHNRQLNHKVVSVEFLNYTVDTGDITVEKYHNFAVSSGVIVSNSALSEENILFARAVINHQKYLNHQLTELLKKIFDLINPELAMTIFDTVIVSFPVPKSLQFERESRYMNELTNLIESLERIGIPKEYAKKKYLPQMDWDEIKKYDVDRKVETALDPTKKAADEQFGYGPMGGVGGAPPPGAGGMPGGGGGTF